MSTRPATSRARPRRVESRRRQVLRRVAWFLALVVVAGIVVAAVVAPRVDKAVQEVVLPLRHEDIIRQQAEAKGLMQLMPSTADYIARKSGGTRFRHGDLATPQINISYGSFYLRYLLDRYDGNHILALAAYNAGEGKINEWRANARSRGETFKVADHIPYPETRDYVSRVLRAQEGYRRDYARELGL